MSFEFDPAKDAINQDKHGISLARAQDFEIRGTVIDPYPDEVRFRSFGLIDGRAYCLVYTLRSGAVRAISLRRARNKEFNRYVPVQQRLSRP
ncbi:BrnT family toxin [Brevundimonas staleyi]|uniref:BrnT family toxin n=1 Tax=Brevundimonas staleyi TaxID=74326 RepID=A0ABW0FVI6_9CAUL